MDVEAELFPQAPAWSKTFTPMRTVVAEVADEISVSVLILPRESLPGGAPLPCNFENRQYLQAAWLLHDDLTLRDASDPQLKLGCWLSVPPGGLQAERSLSGSDTTRPEASRGSSSGA